MERTIEGATVLLNDIWHSAVINFGCVSSRILWIEFKFSRVKVCVVVGYGPSGGMKKGRGSGMTWTGLWIETEISIDYLCWKT